MAFRPDKPYNELPLLPPRADIETRALLKSCITARAALAELKGVAERIPNQAVLIKTIPLLEAQASSEIENIVTTSDRLFRFANDPGLQADNATKEALRYRTALYEGFKLLAVKPLSTATAIQICQTIKGVDLDIRTTPGTTLVNHITGKVIYSPPQGIEVLREKLSNWERYIHTSEDIDPLIRMAVMHYQFEAIHPFIDGNGRTGRILNLLYLVETELLNMPILYLSQFINNNRSDYYRLLLLVTTENKWEEWILFMLRGVTETAQWTTRKIKSIHQLISVTTEKMRQNLPKIYSRELAEMIFEQPYCRISDLVNKGIVKRQSASSYLKDLCEIGILQEQKFGREKLFVNPAFLDLLTSAE